MKSIKNLYKIGLGPSSSHTMGPSFAAIEFLNIYPQADFIKVTLFGSLSKTGKDTEQIEQFQKHYQL